MRILHLTDPHFGTEVPVAVQAVADLAHALRPDVLVLSGDITQRARRRQFAAARAFVERLQIGARLVIPGNHDIPLFNLWQRLADPYAGYRRAFGEPGREVVTTPDLLAIPVKTTRRWRHKHGQVSLAQIDAVVQRLRHATPRQLRVVVVHQPMDVPRREEEHNLLRNAARAARAWSQAGADLVLGGHIHLPCVLPMSGRYPGLARELWCVQAGTAVSSRIRHDAPQSLNLIDYESGREAPTCRVQRWDLRPGTRAFAQVGERLIPLQR